MSLQSRLADLIAAIGADVKQLRDQDDLFRQKYISGRYYGFAPSGPRSTAVPPEAVAYLFPVIIDEDVTFDQISCEVASAGTTGALLRLVIYDDNGLTEPNSPIYTGTQISGTSIGKKTWAGPFVLPAGIYWMGIAVQGGATTRPTLRIFTTNVSGLQPSANSDTFGADSFTAEVPMTGLPPNPYVRASNVGTSNPVRLIGRVA